MRYQDFIAELRGHVAEADRLLTAKITDADADFRTWRHRVESLVTEASAHGYRLPGKFTSSERYYLDPYDHSLAGKRKGMAADLRDSKIELEHLIDQFEKYGVPPLLGAMPTVAVADPATPPEVAYPERITFAWLHKHVPVSMWLTAGGIVLAAFLFGVAVARSPSFAALEEWVHSVTPKDK